MMIKMMKPRQLAVSALALAAAVSVSAASSTTDIAYASGDHDGDGLSLSGSAITNGSADINIWGGELGMPKTMEVEQELEE
eukprot:4422140-Ditylum_brightwellii.AAC.1